MDAGSYDLEVVPTGSGEVALSLPDAGLEGGTAVGQAGDGSLGAVFADDAQTGSLSQVPLAGEDPPIRRVQAT